MKNVTPSYICLITLCVAYTLAWPLHSAHADINTSTLCNEGSTSLYFASVAEHKGMFQSAAMTQGLVEVAPGKCVDLVPSGMNKVMLTFFKKDRRGILTNLSIVPKNATRVTSDVKHVCVNMRAPYRLFGTRQSIFATYVNAACPQGFSPATPAWIHQPGGLTEYKIAVHADTDAVPWRDQNGRQYTAAPVLRTGSLQSAGTLIQANPSSVRDNKAAQAMLEAGKEYWERTQQQAQQRRAQQWQRQQQQRAQYDAKVEQAEQALVRPSDEICQQYTHQTVFKRAGDVAISGVKLGMDLDSAHTALLCHGFSIDPSRLARAGGVKAFWSNAREKTFQKSLPDGTLVFTDVETRPPRGAPAGADFVVLSVRVRFQHRQPLSETDWQRVRSEFKAAYPAGRHRSENPIGVRSRFKLNGVLHTLELMAQDYRAGRLSRYSITII
ncbi:MAG: hypothetical protein V2I41_07590 [Pseudomonadales bacterium]|jgi:hypothetical protein|nr:hypothetical protein [Pseudomonadales bacterium]